VAGGMLVIAGVVVATRVGAPERVLSRAAAAE